MPRKRRKFTKYTNKNHGIKINEDGVTNIRASNSSPKPCIRCQVLVEGPWPSEVTRKNKTIRGAVCQDCICLSITDTQKFFSEGWENK